MNQIQANRLRSYWRKLPDPQAVTVYKQTAPAVYSGTAGVTAFRRPQGLVEADVSKGVYLFDKVDWLIPKEKYPAYLYPGDTLTWAHPTLGGLLYTVGKEGVEEVGALGTWRLHCVRPNFNAALTRVVTVYRPQPGQDAGGGVTRGTPTVVAGPFPAALQQFSTFSVGGNAVEAQETWGKRITPVPVKVYCPVSFRVQPHDYLVDDAGLSYTINADSNFGVLAEFMALDTYLIPSG